MDQYDGPRARAYRFSKSREINLPATIVDQAEWAKFHVVNRGEKLEEGIAWLRDHNFVAWLAQQPKQERICLACASRKDQTLHIKVRVRFFLKIVLRHSSARLQQPLRLRIVPQSRRSSQGGENSGFVILEAAYGRIRHGQIEDGLAACAMAVQRARVGVFLPWPIGAF